MPKSVPERAIACPDPLWGQSSTWHMAPLHRPPATTVDPATALSRRLTGFPKQKMCVCGGIETTWPMEKPNHKWVVRFSWCTDLISFFLTPVPDCSQRYWCKWRSMSCHALSETPALYHHSMIGKSAHLNLHEISSFQQVSVWKCSFWPYLFLDTFYLFQKFGHF